MKHPAWIEKGSASNALAVASRAASGNGQTHYVTGVCASFSGAATALLQIKKGTTVIFEQYINNSQTIQFTIPLDGGTGAVSAELAAGGSGITGKVNLIGFTY